MPQRLFEFIKQLERPEAIRETATPREVAPITSDAVPAGHFATTVESLPDHLP
jgi:hypothetical protein